MHGNFEAGRRFANHIDFQGQPDGWCDRVSTRTHRTTRAVIAERFGEERERMRPLPNTLPDMDRRFVARVPGRLLTHARPPSTLTLSRGSGPVGEARRPAAGG